MTKIPIPINETERLNALKEYNILDTINEKEFDRLVQLVALICQVPIALVSLIDEDRQWFKASKGHDVPQTPRDISFCQFAIMGDEKFEVEDAANDDRFKNSPLVTDHPNIRFYAGYPLKDPNGYNLGTLCVIDREPKKLNEDQALALKLIGQEVMSQIISRKNNIERESYKKLFIHSMDMICFFGTNGYFKKINPAFSKTLGWSESELLSKSLIEFVHPDDVEATLKEVEKLGKGGQTLNFQNRYRKQDGSYLILNWVANPDPKTGELFAIARDITDNENIKKQLNNEKEAIDNAVLRAELFIDGRLSNVNDNFCNLLQYNKEDLLNINHSELLYDEDKNIAYDEFWENLKKGVIQHGEFKRKTKTGTQIWIKGSYIPIKDADNQVEKVIKIAYNITSQKEFENELINAKDVAQHAVKAKDEFLANMSHEIRTPLNAIMGFNDLLQKTELTNEQENYTSTVATATQNLMVIINDVLDIAKLESGKFELENKPINIKELAQQVIKLQSNIAKDKGVKLMLSIDHEIPDFVFGDHTRLTQILINLVGNALKFTYSGFVELRLISNYTSDQESNIRFSVKDTGIGIDESKLSQIFDRFVQAETSITRMYGGTGLGLSIVKMLVDLQDGKLDVHSEVDKGSEFSFEITFKITDKLAVTRQLDGRQSNDLLKNISILLVEDNEHNQVLASTYLKKQQAIVDIAANGAIAIEKIKQQKYDIILMDLQMPIMDGYTATSILRNEMQLKIPIIACSAHSLVGERTKCLEIGMDEYISKPYSEKTLIEAIAKYADKLGILSKIPNHQENSVKQEKPIEDDSKNILSGLEKEHGNQFVEMMVSIFTKRIPLDIITLESAIEKNDLYLLSQTSHLICGSLSSINFTNGATLAKKVETFSNNNEKEKALLATHQLIGYLRQTLNSIN